MPILIPTFLSYLLIIGSARAQITVPNCTDPTLAWSSNSLQQSPCFVGASLEAVCNGGLFNVPSLQPGESYMGPHVGQDNGCICNTIVYSLISACGACQQTSWISYSAWTINCTTNATAGILPIAVPRGTRVPKWAYVVPFIDGSWNITVAKAIGDRPEVTGTFTFSATTLESGSSSTSLTLHTSSNHGRIEGGVIGGVIGGTLISAVAVWFVIYRRRARCELSIADTMGKIEQPVPDSLTIESPRLYDPLDPTTYPRREFQPQRFGCTSHPHPSQLGYSGLPEV